MGARIIIQHVGGSKINQIEQFQVDDIRDEITIGRDPGSVVAFDAQRDSIVSRRHAVIKVTRGDTPTFKIADQGSSNGTLVNGERITGEYELIPGDIIELGASGPKFSFDIQPRPPHLVARTRIIGSAALGPATGATRIVDVATAASTTIMPPPSTKVGVGRETVQRLLTEERQATSRIWMYLLAGVLAFVGLVGGGLYYRFHTANEQTAAALASAQTALNEKISADAHDVQQRMGLTPQEIAHKYGNSTVFIEVRWRLFDRGTGKPLYHKRFLVKNELIPAFVRRPDGEIVRWLTNEDENHSNVLIGGEGSGTGFVISEQGFILTNKHVGAGWQVPWREREELYDQGDRLVFNQGDKELRSIRVNSDDAWQAMNGWIPDQGGIVFSPRLPIPLAGSPAYEGQNEKFSIRFAGNRLSIEGRLIRSSTDADVAVAKIDAQESLAAVAMAPDDGVKVGERVTVLGYPGFSVKTFALITTIEGGELQKHREVIPEPTVTEGLISRLSASLQNQGAVTTLGEMGDAYQLSVPSGSGNSGGPVFNAAGKVIGLFTYGTNRETTTFAVPIRYGRDLLQLQRPN